MKQMFIYITDTIEFIHRYIDAPDEVYYLRYPHRHLAHIKVTIEVYHNDRELEFILVKHELQAYMKTLVSQLGDNCSCEMFADMLLSYLQEHYGTNRDIEIVVNEDNENGCRLVYRKEA